MNLESKFGARGRWPLASYPPFPGIGIDLDLWVRGGGPPLRFIDFLKTAPIEEHDAEAKDT